MNPTPDEQPALTEKVIVAQDPILNPDPIVIPASTTIQAQTSSSSLPAQAKDSGLSSSPELASLFSEYLNSVQNRISNKKKDEEKKCWSLHDNPENYAKCMYAFEKDVKDVETILEYKTNFLKKKMENCLQNISSKQNKDEAVRTCFNSSKEVIERVLKSF